MKRRVVVTGVGVICALGRGPKTVWEALIAGRSGVGPLTSFDTSEHRVHIAAEAAEMRGQRTAERMTWGAFDDAWRDAGLVEATLDPTRIGIAVGLLGGEALIHEKEMLASPGVRSAAVTPETAEWYPPAAIARRLAADYGVEGPVATLANACSAGNHALSSACDWIRSGRADVVLAGGTGAVSYTGFSHFDNLRALAPEYCSPFDLQRRGLVLGDGCCWLVAEEWASARRRGVTPLAEVLGFGFSCDGHNVVSPHPEGRGAISVMRNALEDAGISPDQVDYVSAHGTATRANDPVEARALRSVFGERAIPASSIKSMIGHTMGAASAIESFSCCEALRTGIVPPTINYHTPDPECPVDCVPNEARELDLRIVLNNSFAFGGNNCSVVFGSMS